MSDKQFRQFCDIAKLFDEFAEDLEALYNFKFGDERDKFGEGIAKFNKEIERITTHLNSLEEFQKRSIGEINENLNQIKDSLRVEMTPESVLNHEKQFSNASSKIKEVYASLTSKTETLHKRSDQLKYEILNIP